MPKTKLTPYDTATYLRTPKEIAYFLEAAFEEAKGDSNFIIRALKNISRSKGLIQLEKKTGFSREGFIKACSKPKGPKFDVVLNLIQALNMKLGIKTVRVRKVSPKLRPSL